MLRSDLGHRAPLTTALSISLVNQLSSAHFLQAPEARNYWTESNVDAVGSTLVRECGVHDVPTNPGKKDQLHTASSSNT